MKNKSFLSVYRCIYCTFMMQLLETTPPGHLPQFPVQLERVIILRGEALRRIGVCKDVAMMMASSKPSASASTPRSMLEQPSV
jgi:hypothetical protein